MTPHSCILVVNWAFGARSDHNLTRGWTAKLSANANKLGQQVANIKFTNFQINLLGMREKNNPVFSKYEGGN